MYALKEVRQIIHLQNLRKIGLVDIGYMVKNKKNFLSLELLLKDFLKILFCEIQVSRSICLSVEFNDRRSHYLEESNNSNKNNIGLKAEVLLSNTSWFMYDPALPHRTANVFNFLNEHFDDRVIALDHPTHTGSSVDWPPYSPDMSPCDFVRVHLKDQVYCHNSETVEQLQRTFFFCM